MLLKLARRGLRRSAVSGVGNREDCKSGLVSLVLRFFEDLLSFQACLTEELALLELANLAVHCWAAGQGIEEDGDMR
jgi:hypothetical protein